VATWPYTATKPAHWTTISSAKRNHLFYVGDTLTFTLNKQTASTYDVIDYYGTVVASGNVTSTTITITAKPCGWYRLYLWGSTNDPDYGTLYGSSQFSVINVDARFPTHAAPGKQGYYSEQSQADQIIRGVVAMGPERYQIENAASPTSGNFNIAAKQAGRTLDASWYNNPTYEDANRPRPAFVLFTNGTTGTGQPAGVTTTVSTLYPSIEWYEGPQNEPTVNAGLVPAMQTFYNAVKAGNASAKVLGPNPVSIGDASGINAFLAAGGGAYLDGLSVHIYNDNNGDLARMRYAMRTLTTVLQNNGFNKPLWQTEQGINDCDYGVYKPRMSGHWTMVNLLVCEQFGIPKERYHVWYALSHGFWNFPHFFEMSDGTLKPLVAMIRGFSEAVYGKPFTSAYDFGTPGNDMYLGSLYTNPTTGARTVALMSGGVQDGEVTFDVTGMTAGTLFGTDCFGNAMSWPVSGSVLDVPMLPEPQYVDLPAGVTLTHLG
jgi:hypothetical protein